MRHHAALRPARRLLASAAAACAAQTAHAVDWSGYLRGGPAATTVPDSSRQCFGLNGQGLKYRLGNECDFYGEFQLAQKLKAGDLDYRVAVTGSAYSPQTDNTSNNVYALPEAYVEVKGVDFSPSTVFWVGRHRDRADVHIVDTFFTDMSGLGAGFGNIDTGLGLFAFSTYKTDTAYLPGGSPAVNGGTRVHADFYRMPVNPGGTLRVTLSYGHGDTQGTLPGTPGVAVNIEHLQSDFLGLGGENHLWFQAANGSMALNNGFGTLTAPTSTTRAWRFIESPTWQVGGFGGQAVLLIAHEEAPSGRVDSLSLGGRGSYGITRHLKWLTEVGFSQRRPAGSNTQNLTKLTVGPAVSTGPEFWKRPELRLYATFAAYNAAAAAGNTNNLPAGTTHGASYGAQAEIWF